MAIEVTSLAIMYPSMSIAKLLILVVYLLVGYNIYIRG